MSSRKRKCAAVLATIIVISEAEKAESSKTKCIANKRRRTWSKQWLLERPIHGAFNTFVQQYHRSDPELFRNFTRLSVEQFDHLADMVRENIRKENTVMRDSISPEERLMICLRFLATGDSYPSIGYLFRVHKSTVSEIVIDVCKAIYAALEREYLKFPATAEEWESEADAYEKKWNFPHCAGSLDGKHVRINSPHHSGSCYFNYKGYCSIILLAVANANYEFSYIDVGTNGRVSDSGVFRDSTLHENELDNGTINFPAMKEVRPSGAPVPYFLIGDDAFPLKTYLMKPYGGKQTTEAQRIFNYRLSRARRMVESAFGLLCARFQVFTRPLLVQPQKAEIVTLAACALHNFIKRTNAAKTLGTFADQCDVDITDSRFQLPGISQQGTNTYNHAAKSIREELTDYFLEEGSVDWQWSHA